VPTIKWGISSIACNYKRPVFPINLETRPLCPGLY
jgi:hypothetical protein